jgi:hypothetical protein
MGAPYSKRAYAKPIVASEDPWARFRAGSAMQAKSYSSGGYDFEMERAARL